MSTAVNAMGIAGVHHPSLRFFDDFQVGDRFVTASMPVTEKDIIAFGRSFDPQWFHTNTVRSAESAFGGLVASGWHTASITMRLMLDAGIFAATGLIGVAVDEMRWPSATRPGDVLHAVLEVLDKRASNSKPDRGIMRIKIDTLREDDTLALSYIATVIIGRRPEE